MNCLFILAVVVLILLSFLCITYKNQSMSGGRKLMSVTEDEFLDMKNNRNELISKYENISEIFEPVINEVTKWIDINFIVPESTTLRYRDIKPHIDPFFLYQIESVYGDKYRQMINDGELYSYINIHKENYPKNKEDWRKVSQIYLFMILLELHRQVKILPITKNINYPPKFWILIIYLYNTLLNVTDLRAVTLDEINEILTVPLFILSGMILLEEFNTQIPHDAESVLYSFMEKYRQQKKYYDKPYMANNPLKSNLKKLQQESPKVLNELVELHATPQELARFSSIENRIKNQLKDL